MSWRSLDSFSNSICVWKLWPSSWVECLDFSNDQVIECKRVWCKSKNWNWHFTEQSCWCCIEHRSVAELNVFCVYCCVTVSNEYFVGSDWLVIVKWCCPSYSDLQVSESCCNLGWLFGSKCCCKLELITPRKWPSLNVSCSNSESVDSVLCQTLNDVSRWKVERAILACNVEPTVSALHLELVRLNLAATSLDLAYKLSPLKTNWS